MFVLPALLGQSPFHAEPYSLDYENVRWEKGKILITGFHLVNTFSQNRFAVDGISLSLGKDSSREEDKKTFGTRFFQPAIQFIHPQVVLKTPLVPSSEKRGSRLLALFPCIKWHIEHGVLQIGDEETRRFYYALRQEEKRGDFPIYSLAFAQDPKLVDKDPALRLELFDPQQVKGEEEELGFTIQFAPFSCKEGIRIFSFFSSFLQKGSVFSLDPAQVLTGSAQAFFQGKMSRSFQVTSWSGKGQMHNLSFSSSKGLFAWDNASFCFKEGQSPSLKANFPRMEVFVKGGSCQFYSTKEQGSLTDLDAHLIKEPDQDLCFTMQGMLFSQGIETPFSFTSSFQGSLADLFWSRAETPLWELQAALKIREEKLEAALQACALERYRLQLSAHKFSALRPIADLYTQVFGGFPIPLRVGEKSVLSGEAILEIEKGQLSQIGWTDLQAEGLILEYSYSEGFLHLGKLLSSGKLKRQEHSQEWKVEHGALVLEKAAGDFLGEKGILHLEGKLLATENEIQEGFFRGDFAKIPFLYTVQGPFSHIEMTLETDPSFSLLQALLKKRAPYSPKQPVFTGSFPSWCRAHIQMQEGRLKVRGALHLGQEDKIEFGGEIPPQDRNTPVAFLDSVLSLKKPSTVDSAEGAPQNKEVKEGITGWFFSTSLQLSHYQPLLQELFPFFSQTEGSLQLQGRLQGGKFSFAFLGKKLLFSYPQGSLFLEEVGHSHLFKEWIAKKTSAQEERLKEETAFCLEYDFHKRVWQGSFPIAQAQYRDKATGLVGDFLATTAFLEYSYLKGGYLRIDHLEGISAGLQLKGSLVCFPLAQKNSLEKRPLSPYEGIGVTIGITDIVGDALHWENLLHKFVPSFPKGYLQSIRLGKKGAVFSFSFREGENLWGFSADIQGIGGTIPGLEEQLFLEEGGVQVGFDPSLGVFTCRNIYGKLKGKRGAFYELTGQKIDWSVKPQPEGVFTLFLKRQGREIMCLSGKVAPTCSQATSKPRWLFSLDSKAHFLQEPLSLSCVWGKEGVEKLTAKILGEVSLLQEEWEYTRGLGLFPFYREKEALYPVKGKLAVGLSYEGSSDLCLFSLKSPSFKMGESAFYPLEVQGEKKGPYWVIKKGDWGEFKVCSSFTIREKEIELSSLELCYRGYILQAKGNYDKQKEGCTLFCSSFKGDLGEVFQSLGYREKGEFSSRGVFQIFLPQGKEPLTVKGELDLQGEIGEKESLGISFYSARKIQGTWYGEQGAFWQEGKLVVEELPLVFYSARACKELSPCSVEQGEWTRAKGKIKKVRFTLAPSLLEVLMQKGWLSSEILDLCRDRQVVGSCEVAWDKEVEVKGHLDKGTYLIKGYPLFFEEISFLVSPTLWEVKGQTRWQEKLPLAFWMKLKKGSSPEALLGVLKVWEPKKKGEIHCLFRSCKKKIVLEKIEGALKGIEVHLHKEDPSCEGKLSGGIKMDLSSLSAALFPQGKFSLGKGYSWQGDLFYGEGGISLQGKLRGKNAEVGGILLDHLEVDTDCSSGKILLHDLKLEDEAGSLEVKKIQILKEEGDKWIIEMPYAYVRQFKPSCLRQKGKPFVKNSFVLQNLSVHHLQGYWGDLLSFTGGGEFQFSTPRRKESLLGGPLEAVKNLGLDPGILTPVKGEGEYKIRQGRCFFTDLKQVYSEGERSQFFLAEDEEKYYLDWQGNICLDLKMRQQVALKMTEPFILKIRGTLMKPRYSLEKR